jgi:hypothetical protein
MKKKFRVIKASLSPYDWCLQRFIKKSVATNIEIWETLAKCSKKSYAYFLKNALEKDEPAFQLSVPINDRPRCPKCGHKERWDSIADYC